MKKTTLLQFIAGLIIATLVLLFLKWGSEALYTAEAGHETEPVYPPVVEAQESAPAATETSGTGATSEAATSEATTTEAAAPAAEPTFEELYAAADATAGKKVFNKCKACHKLEEGKNATGPYLFGVVGRPQASVEGFKYSEVLAGKGGVWTPEELNLFLTDTKAYAPGTKMTLKGVKGAENRANLIAYLATFSK